MNRPDLKILGRSDGFYFCPSFFDPKELFAKQKCEKIRPTENAEQMKFMLSGVIVRKKCMIFKDF